MKQYSRLNNVMEARDHFKNGARPKGLKSKGIFVFFALLAAVMMAFFTACDNVPHCFSRNIRSIITN